MCHVETYSLAYLLIFPFFLILFQCLLYSGDDSEGKSVGFSSPWCCSSESLENVVHVSPRSLCAAFVCVALRKTIKQRYPHLLLGFVSCPTCVCPVIGFDDYKSAICFLQLLEDALFCASTIYCRCAKILKCVISQSSAWKPCVSHPNRTIIHSVLICSLFHQKKQPCIYWRSEQRQGQWR